DSSYMHEYNLEDIMFTNLQSDGIKEKVKEKMADPQKMSITDKEDKSSDNSGLYSEEDEPELKKLLKEIGVLLMEAKKSKNFYESKTKNVRMKLQQLMDMRLDNGDTFLHMTLCNNTLPSMEFIVKLIHSLQMTPTLNLVNNKSQTILHLAIMNNMPDYVPFLISNGCDPMIKDHQGNNAIHYAVIYKSCLSPLLCSMKSNCVNCDLDCYNDDKQTALHIAAQYGPAESVSLLLEHGAGHGARDIDGRTPLHLAAYDDSVANTEALLAYVPANEIDVVDGNTNTALQIVCGLQHQHSVDIARLLLDKGANPLKCDDKKKTAWALAERNLELMTLLKRYISSEHNTVEDIKPESEDEYESTVEDITETGMEDLPKYINEVSAILDRSNAWRELAKRLHQDTLLSCYEKLSSPTSVLLAQLKESQENFSSESLAMILNDMGEKEAANIIYTCLD
ncbi:Nuclear factor NF-kappa-B p100 subunit, partial [Eumeta japonica]